MEARVELNDKIYLFSNIVHLEKALTLNRSDLERRLPCAHDYSSFMQMADAVYDKQKGEYIKCRYAHLGLINQLVSIAKGY